jgi:hypothetical protein
MYQLFLLGFCIVASVLMLSLYRSVIYELNRPRKVKPLTYAPVTPNSQQYQHISQGQQTQNINQARRRRAHSNPPATAKPPSQANIPPYNNPLDPTAYAPITPNSQQYQEKPKKPKQKQKNKALKRDFSTPPATRPTPPAPIGPDVFTPLAPPARSTHYSSAIETKLIRLCQGDRKVAMRLVAHTRNMHPGRDEQWIYEKACWDLERDRH